MTTNATYERLLAILDKAGADYRLIDHPPEEQTEIVSQFRGDQTREAAKCIIMLVKPGRKTTKYALGVIPGDKRISLAKVKVLLGATYVGFASKADAERLGGSAVGTILPFSFDPSFDLLVDPSLQAIDTIFFNAGLLDRSIGLKPATTSQLPNRRFSISLSKFLAETQTGIRCRVTFRGGAGYL